MGSSMIDAFGRRHNNLRISVTDRCNLRCTYCMPEDVTFLDKSEMLTFRGNCRIRPRQPPTGIDKIRLTGGEPLMRRDLDLLVRNLLAIPGIHDLAVTTNGLLLAAQARELIRCRLCGGSTSASIRSIRSASTCWLGGTGWIEYWKGSPLRGRSVSNGSKSMPLSSAAPTMSILFPWVGPPASMVGN